jgi:putative colanic acid biosynthesis UDP-glucose lipid carrier transferase
MIRSAEQNMFELFRRLADVLMLGAAAQLVSLFYLQSPLGELPLIYIVLLYTCAVLTFFSFSKLELYDSWRGRSMSAMFGRLTLSWAFILFVGILLSFFIHRAGELSRLWVVYWFIVGTIFLVVHRVAVYYALRYLRRTYGVNTKGVVIVGYGRIGKEMHKRAQDQDWFGYNVDAVHADIGELDEIDDTNIYRIHKMESIHAYVVTHNIREIWITLPMSESAKLQRLQYLLRNTLVDVRLIPDTYGLQILSNRMAYFMGVPTVDLNRPHSQGIPGLAKDAFDKLFALAVLTVLAVPFAMIAILIKCSSRGPVYFKQARHGLNGKKFMIYKFRTMEMHREPDMNTITQAKQNDPRITPIGRFIRRTSIDELPQFINVLMGDMSIVGPRPHAVQHNEKYEDLLDVYMLRHRVKPGITGWAQIHGHRGETDTVDKMQKRVQFDLHYIRNWSLWLDMRIIVWTAFKGWTGNNAY